MRPKHDDDEETVELPYRELLDQTDDAWHLRFEGDDVWLPKSQVELDEDFDVVTMPKWLARDRCLTDEMDEQ